MKEIVDIISSVGFPVVCAGAVGLYVREITTSFQNNIIKISESHHNEVKELSEKFQTSCEKLTEAINELKTR